MSLDRLINLLVAITLIEMMALIGLQVSFSRLVETAKDWRLIARAAAANYLMVPALAAALLVAFEASPMVAAGILVLAVCPGAPFGPPLVGLARGDVAQAVGLMAEDRRDVGLLAVTSADRLNAGWTAAQRARERGFARARSHIERLFADLPSHCGIVTVLDGYPATLAWLGAVGGHRVRSLGVEHFGQTGSLAELYRHYGIDANAIVAAAEMIAPGAPIRHLRALGSLDRG